MNLSFRPAHDADRTFIVSNWSSCFKKSHSAGIIHTDDWASVMHAQLERVLDRPGSRALIAFEKSEPDFFYGFIAGDTSEETPVVHYVYVKEAYRRSGIARGLFDAFGVDPSQYFVYVCRPVMVHLTSKVPLARFNPNEVRYPKESRRRPL